MLKHKSPPISHPSTVFQHNPETNLIIESQGDLEHDDIEEEGAEPQQPNTSMSKFDALHVFECRLGLEIVLHILSWLSSADLAAFASTCKRFQEYASHPAGYQWTHLHLFLQRRNITDKGVLWSRHGAVHMTTRCLTA